VIKKIPAFTVCFLLFFYGTRSQNAPVTTLPVVTACPGSVISVPVTVTGFTNIGGVTLTMSYDITVLSYINATNTSGFPGLTINGTIPGKITIAGFSGSFGVNLPNGATFITINFTYHGGSTAISWFTLGNNCEYSDYPNYNPLNDIPKSTYYINGQTGPTLGVDFTAGNLLPSAGQVVQFTDLTTGQPTGWNWNITPTSFVFVNGTGAGNQNPQVQFTSNGYYTVTLTASKNGCNISTTKPNYINCVQKGLWTGNTSADWNIPSNWSNYAVPDNTTDVVIPSSTINWPVYYGNLTIGSQCNSLVLQGSTSRMTVTGNLVIPSSK